MERPTGQHDDTVMALALAWSAVSQQHRLIYPIPDVKLVIPDFPIPDHWPRAYGLDIHWNSLAAIWGARDPQSDVLYLFGEYDAEADSALHAATIRSRGDWIVGLMDPKAHGRNQADGYQLMQRYRNLGFLLEAVSNPLESGILEVWQRMQSGRLKVFGSLSRYLQEHRLYRKDENDQVVPDHDSLQDAMRCLVNGISKLSTQTKPFQRPTRNYGGSLGWMR
jgi:hypothetical protein